MITWLDEPAVHQHLWTRIIQISTSNAGEVKLHWVTTVNSEETCKTGKSNFSPSLSAQCLASSITIFPLLLVFWLPNVPNGYIRYWNVNGNRYAGFCEVHGCDCGRTDGTTAKADAINKQAAENGEGRRDRRCFKRQHVTWTRMAEPLCCPPVIITTLLIGCSPV